MGATIAVAKHEAAAGRPRPGAEPRVVVLVPAHDEEGCIAEALRSVWAQSRVPDRVMVAADNCSDGTAEVARLWGAEVFETVGNAYKKACVLNQAERLLLPQLGDDAAVLVMDADSFLDEGFVEHA